MAPFAIAGLCVLGFGLLVGSTVLGRQALNALRFTLGWVHIAPQQQQLVDAVAEAVRSTHLPVSMHRKASSLPQWRGRETWHQHTHIVRLPSYVSPSIIEDTVREAVRRKHHTMLDRHERVGPAHTAITLVVGIAGLPTDIFVLQQPRADVSASARTVAAVPRKRTARGIEQGQTDEVTYVRPQLPGSSRVAIVIDDLGWDFEAAQALLALEGPLSLAILPDAPHRMFIAREARRQGLDVLLHMPMEPHRYPDVDPGRPVLLSTMGAREVATQLEAALVALPSATGVNNHMGSRLTENRQALQIVMQQLKRHNLFFLDSRTTSHSLAYQIAQQMGIPTARRHVFLDHDPTPESIRAQLRRLAKLAQTQGSAIGIGHPYPETVQALRTALPELRQSGITLVPVSALMR